MYAVEAKLNFRPNLEYYTRWQTWGLKCTDPDNPAGPTLFRNGSKTAMESSIERMQKEGKLPDDAIIEPITEIEQAELYAANDATTKTFQRAKLRQPDLLKVVEQRLPKLQPDFHDFLGGEARLWREDRFITRFSNPDSFSNLQRYVSFDPQSGEWQDDYIAVAVDQAAHDWPGLPTGSEPPDIQQAAHLMAVANTHS
jgi:hypothetical protein